MKVDSKTWDAQDGLFVGNECSWPSLSDGRLHGCKQHHVNEMVAQIAAEMDGEPLLTLDAHFVRPETKAVQDILLQNGNKTGWRASSAYYQMNGEQAWNEWRKNHGTMLDSQALFCRAVENNTRFAELIQPISFPKEYHLPEVELPPSIIAKGRDENASLVDFTLERIREHGRLPTDPVRSGIYLERLRKELNVIAYNGKINFLPYFLVIDLDVTSFMGSIGRLVGPGRGSAAGSLLSYLLGITHLDPIEWGLSFERFLSVGRINRGKFPDIDLDFGDPKTVIAHLYQKYSSNFARICTTGTAKLKGAIKDVSRIVLETGENKDVAKEVNDLCETIEDVPQGMDTKKWLYGHEDEAGILHPGYISLNPLLMDFFVKYPEVKTMVDEVLGVPRSVGRHASAYCISNIPIAEIVPMCRVKDEDCTQFTMGPVEALGLIKMDFLGLNTLNDIEGALRVIRERRGFSIDIYKLAHGVPEVINAGDTIGVDITCLKTFAEFRRGNTATVFQFKTKVATPLCISVGPRKLMDLANITANGRPGTMYALMEDGKTTLIDEWVGRRRGEKPVTYLHPDLEPILRDTDGIFTFQEQIMSAFVTCCGFSEEKADEVRELIGKKKVDQMEKILPDIRQRLFDRGWRDTQVDSFISLCVAASSYSFNKSHSLCYAYLGYVCMWLKTNFKIEWWNSVLQNSDFEDMKDAAKHIHDIVEAPDINKSSLDFYIINDHGLKLVFPINRIKNVKGAGIYIHEARNPGGVFTPFESLEDFYNRVERRKVNKRVVASLIWAGAFDRLEGVVDITDRNRVYRKYLEIKKEKSTFVDLTFPQATRAQMELLAIGTSDIIPYIQEKIGKRILSPAKVLELADDLKAHTGGMCIRVSKVKTKTGKNPGQTMAFVEIEDCGTVLSVTVFPDKYESSGHLLEEGRILFIDGRMQVYKSKKNFVASEIRCIGDEIEKLELEEKV